MRTLEQRIFERIDRWLGEEGQAIKYYAHNAARSIPFTGDVHDRDAIDRYCLMRIAEGVDEYLRSFNFGVLSRQREYEKYIAILQRICEEHHCGDFSQYAENIDVPIIEDPGITFVKALHSRKGKTKNELMEELGVTERMVRLNVRKLDPTKITEGGADPGAFRIGGQIMQVPIHIDEDEDGTKRFQTVNTMQPVVMQLSVYQTIIMLDSLWKEYEQQSGLAIGLAASIWGQLSDYTKDRIRFVWGTSKKGFEDFLDEVEELLEGGFMNRFQSEEELFSFDYSSNDDKLIIGAKTRRYLNISLDKEPRFLRHVLVDYEKENGGKLRFCARPDGSNGGEVVTFTIDEVIDVVKCD